MRHPARCHRAQEAHPIAPKSAKEPRRFAGPSRCATDRLDRRDGRGGSRIHQQEEQIAALVAGFTTLKEELENNKKTQTSLFDEFEGYRKRIDDLLADANRTGMAASFTSRRLWLLVPLGCWLGVFGVSIGFLIYMAVIYVVPILNSGNWEQLPARLALTAPLIWLERGDRPQIPSSQESEQTRRLCR